MSIRKPMAISMLLLLFTVPVIASENLLNLDDNLETKDKDFEIADFELTNLDSKDNLVDLDTAGNCIEEKKEIEKEKEELLHKEIDLEKEKIEFMGKKSEEAKKKIDEAKKKLDEEEKKIDEEKEKLEQLEVKEQINHNKKAENKIDKKQDKKEDFDEEVVVDIIPLDVLTADNSF